MSDDSTNPIGELTALVHEQRADQLRQFWRMQSAVAELAGLVKQEQQANAERVSELESALADTNRALQTLAGLVGALPAAEAAVTPALLASPVSGGLPSRSARAIRSVTGSPDAAGESGEQAGAAAICVARSHAADVDRSEIRAHLPWDELGMQVDGIAEAVITAAGRQAPAAPDSEDREPTARFKRADLRSWSRRLDAALDRMKRPALMGLFTRRLPPPLLMCAVALTVFVSVTAGALLRSRSARRQAVSVISPVAQRREPSPRAVRTARNRYPRPMFDARFLAIFRDPATFDPASGKPARHALAAGARSHHLRRRRTRRRYGRIASHAARATPAADRVRLPN